MTATVLAIDVGTSACRVGLFDRDGRLLAASAVALQVLRPRESHVVYRMDAIWNAVGVAVKRCLAVLPEAAGTVSGMAFDATGALLLVTQGADPLEGGADVFGWLDQRATVEAAEITATGDPWIAHMGGAVGADSHLAKLLWLKRRAPEVWARLTAVRDLADALVERATGVEEQALATRATKWPFVPQAPGEDAWRHALLERLDIADVWTLGALPNTPLAAGRRQGRLEARVASTMGLPAGIPVAAGLVDAQAGLLGVIGRGVRGRVDGTVALIGGASTGLMALTRRAQGVPGLCGPFADALFPGFALHEGGQACSGAALDAVLARHPGGPLVATPETHADTVAEILELLEREGAGFAAQLHIVPDWLGNRSPLADGGLRALATGMGEDGGHRAFLETYYATARAIALQARQIIEHMDAHGYALNRVALAGGQARNRLLSRLYRDALGRDLVLSNTEEPVLLGTAMTAAVAGGVYPDLFVAVDMMAPSQLRYQADGGWRRAHEAAYAIYLRLFAARNEAAVASRALAGMPVG
jgi:FGGY-family pentulose kinase